MRITFRWACISLVALALVGCSDDEPAGGSGGHGVGAGSGAGNGDGGSNGGSSPSGSGGKSAASGGGGAGGCDADLASDAANCGACGHDCLGGACLEGACQPVTLVETYASGPIAADGGFVYWFDGETDVLMRVPTTGGAPSSVADLAPVGVYTLDEMVARGGHVVLSTPLNSTDTRLLSVDVASGAVTTLFEATDGDAWDGHFAADDTHVYFVDAELFSIPLGGGSLVALDPDAYLGGYFRRDVAIDDTHLYVAAFGTSGGSALLSVPKIGGTMQVVADVGPNYIAATGTSIVGLSTPPNNSDGCANSTTVRTIGTGQVNTIGTFAGRGLNPVADASHVWFVRDCESDIARIQLPGGGQPELVWPHISNRVDFAADAEALYLWSSPPGGLSQLAKLAK